MSLSSLLSSASLSEILAAARARAQEGGAYSITDLLESMDWYQREPKAWTAWRAFLCAVFALPMTEEEEGIYRQCTGRKYVPGKAAKEVYLIVGRRGGKTRIAGLIATYLAACKDYSKVLAPGQWGTLPLIAADRQQARELMGYVKGNFEHPALSHLLESSTSEEVRLTSRVRIEVHTASYRSTRGYTMLGGLADEIAFWHNETGSANPDKEVLTAIKPGMATVPGSILLALSSPYAQRGVLWDEYKRNYGKDGDVLVWRAPTLTMHNDPLLAQEIQRAYAADPASAAAEYGAEFRPDVDTFVTELTVDACMSGQPTVRQPDDSVTYFGFTDPSGGSSDSMVTAVAHWDHDTKKPTLDNVVETLAPFQPAPTVKFHCDMLKLYRVQWVEGDKYAGEWPKERFMENQVSYRHAERPKSQIYVDTLPFLMSRSVALLQHDKLKQQLIGLDRKTSRAGRDSIDHQDGAKDDVANAVCGALLMAARYGAHMDPPKRAKKDQSMEEVARESLWAKIRAEQRPDDNVAGPARYGGSW
jgi:hypothetical protein